MAAHDRWRVECRSPQDMQANISLATVEFRASLNGPPQTSGAVVEFSSQKDSTTHAAANAFDAFPFTTKWTSDDFDFPADIGLHYPSPVTVRQVRLICSNDSEWQQAPTDVDIMFADGGGAFTSAIRVTGLVWSGPGSQQLISFDFAALQITKGVVYVAVGSPQTVSITKSVVYVATGEGREGPPLSEIY